MQIMNPQDLPDTIAQCRVKGCGHGFYQLSEIEAGTQGRILVVAGPTGSKEFELARRNLRAADVDQVTDCVELEPEKLRKVFGIPNAVMILLHDAPAPVDRLTMEEAREMSDSQFPPAPPRGLVEEEPEPEPEEEEEFEDGEEEEAAHGSVL